LAADNIKKKILKQMGFTWGVWWEENWGEGGLELEKVFLNPED